MGFTKTSLFSGVFFVLSMFGASASAALTVLDTVEWKGSSYSLISVGRWVDAQAFAVTLGGNLATVTTAEENDFLYGVWGKNGSNALQRHARIFIGLSDAEQEGVFKWASGETYHVSTQYNFSVNEPNGGVTENYVHLWDKPGVFSQFGWNDHTGVQQYVSIMEKRNVADVGSPFGLSIAVLLVVSALKRRAQRVRRTS